MAKVISGSVSPLGRSLIFLSIGVALGLLHVALSWMLARYVIDPIACGVGGSSVGCSSSLSVADSIAAILVSTAAVFIGVRFSVMRPVLVAVAVGLFMAGITTWTNGLGWLEAVGWTMLLYGLTYTLFAWVFRYPIIGYSLIVAIVAVVVQRIAMAL